MGDLKIAGAWLCVLALLGTACTGATSPTSTSLGGGNGITQGPPSLLISVQRDTGNAALVDTVARAVKVVVHISDASTAAPMDTQFVRLAVVGGGSVVTSGRTDIQGNLHIRWTLGTVVGLNDIIGSVVNPSTGKAIADTLSTYSVHDAITSFSFDTTTGHSFVNIRTPLSQHLGSASDRYGNVVGSFPHTWSSSVPAIVVVGDTFYSVRPSVGVMTVTVGALQRSFNVQIDADYFGGQYAVTFSCDSTHRYDPVSGDTLVGKLIVHGVTDSVVYNYQPGFDHYWDAVGAVALVYISAQDVINWYPTSSQSDGGYNHLLVIPITAFSFTGFTIGLPTNNQMTRYDDNFSGADACPYEVQGATNYKQPQPLTFTLTQ